MAALWPLQEAIVGVYDHPPPEGAGVDFTYVDTDALADDQLNRELLKTARAATRLKDWWASLIP